MENVIRVNMCGAHNKLTQALYQYDYGQILLVEGISLPESYEVHFANERDGETVTVIGTSEGVQIPDTLLETGKDITAYIYLHEAETDGETEYVIRIPVHNRPRPADFEPTEEEEIAIASLLAAMNSAIQHASDSAKDAAESAAAAEDAMESYEEMTAAATDLPYGSQTTSVIDRTGDHPVLRLGIPEGKQGIQGNPGNDGVSPVVEVIDISGGHRVTITDAEGEHIFYVADGQDGAPGGKGDQGEKGNPGVSPTVTVTNITGGHRIKITDSQGDHTFDVMDGVDGQDGAVLSVNGETGNVVLDGTKVNVNNSASDPETIEDAFGRVNRALTNLGDPPKVVEPEETEADLYVCDANGNVIAKFVNGHIVTKNFNSASIQLDLIMEADSEGADLYISDTFGNVVAEFKNGHVVTKNFDSTDMVDIPGDVESLKAEVAELQSETNGILYRNKDATDGVYAACRYHQPNSTSKQFCLLIAGDIHADDTRMQNMVDYLNAIDAFDAGIMLGDMSGNQYSDTIAFYLEALEAAQKPFLTVLGNHDVAGAASDAELYSKFGDCFQYAQLASGEAVSGKCYYHKDFVTQKIRVIVLMQYDIAGRSTDTGDLCFGQDQINWFISVLNSTPSDYGVIIAEHTNPSRYMTYNMDEKYTSSTWHQSNYAPTVMNGDPVPDIVNAWINGTTVSQTYSYTFDNPPAPLSVSADFTNRGEGEFIAYIGGHWHMDVLGTPTAYTNQLDCHIPAAGLSSATQGDMPRKVGIRSEDSFGVIAVDRDKKTVKVIHIGAHFTKDAVDRLYFKYSYGT